MMAEILDSTLQGMMNECFPIVTKRFKNTDDPWITPAIRKRIKDRKKVFKRQRRSCKWKIVKKETDDMIKKCKKDFFDRFKVQGGQTSKG